MAGNITKERLKTVLEKDMLTVTLSVKGKEIEIEPCLFLNLNEGLKVRGFTVKTDGKKKKIADFTALTAMLSDRGAEEGGYNLKNINGNYNTVEELDAKQAFDSISMAGLLEKYADADRFQLVIPLYDYGFDETQAETAYKKVAEQQKRWCKAEYDGFSEAQKEKLPDFETLYSVIEEECREYRSKNTATIAAHNGEGFFCDEFTRGRTRFTAPAGLWHFYHAVDFVEACAYRIDRAQNDGADETDGKLDNYPALKRALISTEVTFSWHCTTSGSPAKVYTFELNDETRAWLLTHADDYDIERDGFEDLALLKGEKILFSSCTHEHFHTGEN